MWLRRTGRGIIVGVGKSEFCSSASWRCAPWHVSAWAKVWWPTGPQPGVVAMCSLVRAAWAKTRRPEALSTSGGIGRYWAAQWHLARAVGERFRGCRANRLCVIFIKIEALCAAPPEALAHSPSQMPLSSPFALPSQRQLRKDGGGGGGGVARRARAAQAPKAKSCATPCHVLHELVLHVCRPRASAGGGMRVLGVDSAAER